MKTLPVSAIVLTLNEEKNLQSCLASIKDYLEEIIIIDSFSTDNTLDIAKKYSHKIYQRKWINYSKQFIWALENAVIKNEWVLRIDADERWTPEGFQELKKIIENDETDGVYVKMKIFFMGKWIRHGGFYPNYFLRVFKKSKGKMEERWMDEHIFVSGKTIISNIDVFEMNYDRQENISLWTDKHNKYSTREVIEYLIFKHKLKEISSIADLFVGKTERKRWMKEKFYSRMPFFIRPFFYYLYRYIFKLGFLDGRAGLIFHFLQGFWYRFLVDAKIYQIESLAKKNKMSIPEIIKEHYGIDI
jgi:glycosyltransferase involved in cell wall biosynthesis